MIIERTSEDVDNETKELYSQIQPLIEKGYSIHRAIKTVKGLRSVNTKLGWYQRIRQYTISQGYPADINCMKGRPRKLRGK